MQALVDLLGVPLENLTPELIASKVDEAKAKCATISLTAVGQSADLVLALDAGAFYFDCIPPADEVPDVAAELKQWLAERLDIRGDLSAVQERGVALDAADEQLHLLKEHQRRRVVRRTTCRCRGGRTTPRSLPAPYDDDS